MDNNNQKGSSFGKFVGQLQILIPGIIGSISAVVGFVKLAQGNAGLVTLIFLALSVSLVWLLSFYFTWLWKPENSDGKAGLILPALTDKEVHRHKKKEWQRKLVRRLALIGLVMVPLLTIGGWGAWVHVQHLPNNNMVILIAQFDGPGGQSNRVTETILRQLREATENYEDVEIIALGQAVTEQAGSAEARRIAEKKKADIMIWGWYGQTADKVPISANFEVLEPPEYFPDDLGNSASGNIQTFEITELNSFKLQTQLSDEMSFLTLFTLGAADYAANNWEEAIDRFDDALRQIDEFSNNLDLVAIHFYRGTSYLYNERFGDAVTAFDQALDIQPINHQILNNKGLALYELGQYDDAVTAFDQALDIQPIDHLALNNKGNTLYELGQYDEAISAFNQALKIKPDYYEALNNKGVSLDRLGKHDEAISAFNQVLKIKPDSHQALYNKGVSYSLKNDANNTLIWLEKAITLNNDYRDIAKTSIFFDNIRQDTRFQKLVGTDS